MNSFPSADACHWLSLPRVLMDGSVFIVALGAIVAGFVQGLSGFAFSLVAMSFWAWSVEPKLAAPLAVFGALSGQIIAALSVRRGFDFKLLLPSMVGGLAGIPIGISLLSLLDMHLYKGILGALLIVWCPFMLATRRLPRIRVGGRFADGLCGLLGGVCGGIGGFTGPIPTLWCSLRGMEKDMQRSVIQNFNLATLAFTMTSVDRRAAHPNTGCDLFVARSGIGRQQNLRTLDLADVCPRSTAP